MSKAPIPPRRSTSYVRVACVLAVLAVYAFGLFSLQAALIQRSHIRVHHNRLAPPPLAVQQVEASPVRIRIPAIQLDAPVINVGLDEQGFMDIPGTAEEVGWFSLGYVPGMPGHAVMAGHLDTQSGKAAVFWELRRLKEGDIVEVEREDGSLKRFKVTHRATYAADQAPLQELFGASTGSYLNLITCNGAWRDDLQTYDRRLIVYTEAVD